MAKAKAEIPKDMPMSAAPQPVNWLAKIGMITLIILLFLIPLGLVAGIISEREMRSKQVVNEIATAWATRQVVAGPVLTVPYSYGKAWSTAYLLPDSLSIKGQLNPEIRYRGIFKTTVYSGDLQIDGQFMTHDLKSLQLGEENLHWDKAGIQLSLADMRGIRQKPQLLWNSQTLSFSPGLDETGLFTSGMHVNVPLKKGENPKFSLSLKINGSESIQWVPLGKQTHVEVASSWQDPSFIGNYLPTSRHITPKGFDATWDISYFARGFSQAFTEHGKPDFKSLERSPHVFGVSLINTVDFYQQCTRAIKYGILFLVFTFTVYFLFEAVSKTRLHLIQYILVGFALCLFFLFLVSLSELLGFLPAYLLACVPIIGLITAYTRSISKYKNKMMTWVMFLVLVLLYTYLYILLQLEDLSLLFGSIGLFVALAVVMYVTRNIDWYNDKPVD